MKIKLKEFLISLILFGVLVGTISAQRDQQIAYGVLLDNTGSLFLQLDDVKIFGKEIVRQKKQQGVISIFNFVTKRSKSFLVAELELGFSWTQQENSLQYIDKLQVARGATKLIDAIATSSEIINSTANLDKNKFSEKVLVVITDGEDRDSVINLKDLIKWLQTNKIKVYAIGLMKDLKESKGRSKKFLKTLTEETGGHVVYPTSKQKVEDIVKELFSEKVLETK